MARRPRILAPGLVYHAIARGNQRQPTFLTDRDYQASLTRLAEYRKRYGVSLYAYCLAPNHVHLVVQTADAPLSKLVRESGRDVAIGVIVSRLALLGAGGGPPLTGRVGRGYPSSSRPAARSWPAS